MQKTNSFWMYCVFGSGWLFLIWPFAVTVADHISGRAIALGLILWLLLELIGCVGYFVLVVRGLTKDGMAGLGAIFPISFYIALYVALPAIPVPMWLEKELLLPTELPFVDGRFEKPDPDIKLILLRTPTYCGDTHCREILLETRYSVVSPASKGKGWAIYRIEDGMRCFAPENLNQTLSLLRYQIFGRCVIAENIDHMPDVISLERYRTEPARENKHLKVSGWEVWEHKGSSERKLGAQIWGNALDLGMFGWIGMKIGGPVRQFDVLNSALGLQLDGAIESPRALDIGAVVTFLEPFLFHDDFRERWTVVDALRRAIAAPSVEPAQRQRVFEAFGSKLRPMLRSTNAKDVNVALSASSIFDAKNFGIVRDDLIKVAVAPSIKGVYYNLLVSLLVPRGQSKPVFSDYVRGRAKQILEEGDTEPSGRARLAFMMLASGSAENRREAVDTVMQLPGRRHAETVIQIALGGERQSDPDFFLLWSDAEVDQLLARAAKMETPLLADYVLAFQKAIWVRRRTDQLAALLQERYASASESEERARLRALAKRFSKKIKLEKR